MTSSKPNYPPKTPPPNTITWGIRAATHEFGWGHKHSVPNRLFFLNLGGQSPVSARLPASSSNGRFQMEIRVQGILGTSSPQPKRNLGL